MKKLLYFIIILFLCSCGNNKSSDQKAQLEKLRKERDKLNEQIQEIEKTLALDGNIKPDNVIVTEVTPQLFSHYIDIQGRVDGDDNIGVNAKMGGYVTRILVKEGDEVKKGQLLAMTDDIVLQKNLVTIKDQLVYVTNIYNKQKNLWDQKIGSEVQFLTAKNTVESVQNQINALQEQIDMMKITSPISGTVEDIPIKVGQVVSPGFPLFRVINFSTAKVVADVSEAYTSKVNTGDSVKIFFPDVNQEINTKLTFASKYISPTNRSFLIEIKVNPKNFQFRANMLAIIKINDLKKENAIVIPINVIQKSMNEQYVFVSKLEKGKNIARKQSITVGLTYNGLAEVLSGLNVGDNLITTGYQNVKEGDVLKIQ